MLRENDTFKVVSNPGTDKVEKHCLGPVPAFAWDTGWGKTTSTQPFKNGVTEHTHSIGAIVVRQFLPRGELSVPILEVRWSGNTHSWSVDHAVEARQTLHRINRPAPAGTPPRPPHHHHDHTPPT